MRLRYLLTLLLALAMTSACTLDVDDGGAGGGAQPATPSGSTQPAPSQSSEASSPDDALATAGAGLWARLPDVIARVEPSIVTIVTQVGAGSGVVYRDDGVIVSNAHVVGEAQQVTVRLASGTEIPGEVVATDTVTDLAVVRVDRELPAVEFVETLPEVGELVLALGSPLGFENSATAGIVSGLSREIPGSAQRSRALVDLIQTDAAISPGNSGGALVDADGRVVGINEAYIPPQAGAVSIGFAIPAATVTDTVEELLMTGSATHPFVGIVPRTLTPELAEALGTSVDRGVLVTEVVPAGPAADAGLEPGDVVTSLDGERVDNLEDFLGALRSVEPGDVVPVEVARGQETLTVEVELGRVGS